MRKVIFIPAQYRKSFWEKTSSFNLKMFDNSSIHFVFFLHSLSKSTKTAAVSLSVFFLSDEMLSMSSLNSTFLSTNFFCESGLRRPCNCLMFSGCSKSSEYTFRTVWGIFSYFRAVITCSKSTTCKWGYYNIRTTHKRVHIAVSLLIEKVIELPLFFRAL